MGRGVRLWSLAIAAMIVAFVVAGSSSYFRIQPLPTTAEIQNAARRRHAQRLRDLPSLKDLPLIEPMRIEQALIWEPINGLAPGRAEGAKAWYPPNDAPNYPQEFDFRVEYLATNDNSATVVVEIEQFPNEAWPRYFAKWSPNPGLLKDENPSLALTRVEKFNNRIVMDRQFRFPDESGHLWFFWPSGKNLVSVTYRSAIVDEEFLRRYLGRFPSSL